MDLLIGVLGIFILLGIAYLCSVNRKAINFKLVFSALVIQIIFGGFIIYAVKHRPLGR